MRPSTPPGELGQRAKEIVAYRQNYFLQRGIFPTAGEMQVALGYERFDTLKKHIAKIKAAGLWGL